MSRSNRAHHGSWRHEDRRAKFAAFAVTAGLHLIFVAILLRATGGHLEVAQDQNAIQIVFIDRPVAHQVTKTHAMSAVLWKKAIPANADLPDVASSTSTMQLNLAIVPAEINFRRNPIERPARALEATPTRFQVRMMDSSLAGRLRAMTKRQICGELRSALVKKRESAAPIMNTMQRYGCAN